MNDTPGGEKPFNRELIETLQCYLLPGRAYQCTSEFLTHYEKAYDFWHAMIIEGLISERHHEAAKSLYSDDFLHQEEAACLFAGDYPVGLFMFMWTNLGFKANRDRQYFRRYYPKQILNTLIEDGHHCVMTMSQLVVHPDWRKHNIGPGISECLVGFAVKRLLESPASVMLAFSRNNRKTHEMSYRYGAKPLCQHIETYGLDTDILALYPDSVHDTNIPGIADTCSMLWKNKVIAMSQQTFLRENAHSNV